MATQVQWRGGSTAEHATFTGAAREVTVDTQKKTLVVHDGSTAGGVPLMKEQPPVGSAGSPTYTFSGDTNTGIYSPGADQVAISTNGTGRLFVDGSGNVSVGATGAESLLTVRGTNARILVRDEGTPIRAQFDIDSTNSLVRVGSRSSHPFVFTVQDTERMRITSAGLVGVGTSSPSYLFHVQNASADTNTFVGQSGSVGLFTQWRYNATAASAYGEISTFAGSNNLYIQGQSGGGNTILNLLSGRVGIGTTGPAALLHIARSFSPSIRLDNTSTNYWEISNDSNLIFDRGGTERMRLDASGRLLVGTSSSNPAFASGLQVVGSSSAGTQLISAFNNNVNGGELYLAKSRSGTVGTNTVVQSGDSLGLIGFYGADGTTYQPGAYIRAEVDATPGAGDLPTRLVFSTTADGASSPSQAVIIKSNQETLFTKSTLPSATTGWYGVSMDASVGSINVSRNGNNVLAFFHTSNAGGVGGAAVGTISITTTSTAYNTSSDYRLKENVTAVTDGITRLQQLKPSRFNFIADPAKTVDGFIAHEVQAIVPEAITGEKDAVDDEGNPQYQGIDQSKLVPLLTAALQEAIAKIESLEARLTAAGI